MRIRAALILLTLLIVPVLAEPSPKDLLATAFERLDAEDDRFQPYQFIYEVHTFVRDGDGELEEEALERGRIMGFAPDSTETLVLEERKIVGGEDEPKENSEGEDDSKHEGHSKDDGDDNGGKLPEFDEEFRERHEFRFDEWTELDGKPAAAYKIRPEKSKKEYWQGRVWIDPVQGAIMAVDMEPAKRPFGLRSMNIKARYFDFDGRDMPTRMDMKLEVKVPLIVHKKIQVEMRFSEFEKLAE